MSPRKAPPRGPGARSDGEVTGGNLGNPTDGQPNGSTPRAAVTQAAAGAGVGSGPVPQGQQGQLKQDAANTPLPPDVTQDDRGALAASARKGLASYNHGVTPLFAPTERPMEHVTAGAPLGQGPTNPMAMPMPDPGALPIASLLEQAANATGNPRLRALAAQAAAIAGNTPDAGPLAP
jgi:hypothetical protein